MTIKYNELQMSLFAQQMSPTRNIAAEATSTSTDITNGDNTFTIGQTSLVSHIVNR